MFISLVSQSAPCPGCWSTVHRTVDTVGDRTARNTDLDFYSFGAKSLPRQV